MSQFGAEWLFTYVPLFHVGPSPDFRVSRVDLLSRHRLVLRGAQAWFLETVPFVVCCCLDLWPHSWQGCLHQCPVMRLGFTLVFIMVTAQWRVGSLTFGSPPEAYLIWMREQIIWWCQVSFPWSSHHFTIGNHCYRRSRHLRSWAA